MEINIVILDDSHNHIEHLTDLLHKWQEEQHQELRISAYENAGALLADFAAQKMSCHLLFLDIELSKDPPREENGLAVAKLLRDTGYKNPLIFLTSFTKYSLDGYEVQAMNYLLKPLSYEVLSKCMKTLQQQLLGEKLTVKTTSGHHVIRYSSILFLTARKNYTEITTGDEIYTFKEALSLFESRLPDHFIRCNRSNIVNIHCVISFKDDEVELDNGEKIAVTKSCKDQVTKMFINAFT